MAYCASQRSHASGTVYAEHEEMALATNCIRAVLFGILFPTLVPGPLHLENSVLACSQNAYGNVVDRRTRLVLVNLLNVSSLGSGFQLSSIRREPKASIMTT